MSKFCYRDLILNVPEDWQDSSILSWMTPQPPQIRTMSVKEVQSEQPNVVLTRRQISGEADLESFAKGQEQVMASLMPGLKVLTRGERKLAEPLSRALTREFSFDGGQGQLRQLQAYFQSADSFYIFAATSSNDLNFDKLQQQALALLDSLEVSA